MVEVDCNSFVDRRSAPAVTAVGLLPTPAVLERARVQVAEIVSKAIEQASPLIEERRHRLHLDVPEALHVDGDSNRLSQVISNLLTNSAKYTDPGGDITVRAEQRGDQVWLRVRDTGIGIDPERIPHAFERSRRCSRAASALRGLGLGLAIVKSLVEAHGGTVALHSEGVGRGAECVVRLPIAATESSSHPPDAAKPLATPLIGCRFMLVDDRYVPAVALLDLGLPVIDGYELAARLRRQPGWDAVRFAALTGYGQQHARERTAGAGFEAHLVKPVEVHDVDTTLRRLAGLSSGPDRD